MGALILNGVEVPIDAKVLTWKDAGGFILYGHGGYVAKVPGAAPRTITLGVLHATVNGSVADTWKELTTHRKRDGTPQPLGVHFGLAADGTIYQFLDVAETALHASGVNPFAWGVEIVNPWDVDRCEKGVVRPRVPAGVTATGNPRKLVLGYTDAQQKAVLALCEAIHGHLGIPRVLPAPVTDKRVEPTAAGVSAGYEERVRFGGFKGLSGHYNSSPPTPYVHVDPGTALWPAFRSAGWEVA